MYQCPYLWSFLFLILVSCCSVDTKLNQAVAGADSHHIPHPKYSESEQRCLHAGCYVRLHKPRMMHIRLS